MTALLTACAGFLLAVLWMDLIFDSQVLTQRDRSTSLPEPALASIAGYYRRATTTSRPMSVLILLVMLIMVSALIFRAATGGDPGWLVLTAAALGVTPIVLALVRTVPNAKRLGARVDGASEQSRLARAVFADHVVCFSLMLGFVALWLSEAA
jgi:hypothetical protein